MAELARRREAAMLDLCDHRLAEIEGDAQLLSFEFTNGSQPGVRLKGR
jgi:hypothetical protein